MKNIWVINHTPSNQVIAVCSSRQIARKMLKEYKDEIIKHNYLYEHDLLRSYKIIKESVNSLLKGCVI